MSRDSIPVDVPPRHLDSTFPSDWLVVRAHGEVVIVHTPADGVTTYTLGETTRNPRVLAQADAVFWNGDICKTVYKEGCVILQHPSAGLQDELVVEEFLKEKVATLDRTELVDLEATGGFVEFTCSDCGETVQRERHQLDVPGLVPERCGSCTLARFGGT